MPLPDTLKTLINNAWEDGAPLLVATAGPNGPNVGPKGSLVIYDDEHLAYWERTKGALLDNIVKDNRVCVLYANFNAQREKKIESGYLRFFGTAELHESGPVKDKIFALLKPREQTHVGADTGIGVLIKITKAANIRGKSIL